MATKGLKILTTQKRLIMDVVKGIVGPFTAQEVCEKMARIRPKVSRATVYRMLTELNGEGIIREFWLPNNRKICIQGGNTIVGILECADCGKIECFDIKNLELGFSPADDVQTTIHRKVRCPHRKPKKSLSVATACPQWTCDRAKC